MGQLCLILLVAGHHDLGFGDEFFLVVLALSVFAKLLPLSLHCWKSIEDLDPLFHSQRTIVLLLNICFGYKANIQLAFR